MSFQGMMKFPPLPYELYKQWKAIKEVYKTDWWHMLVLGVLATQYLGATNQAQLNELIVEAHKHENPWNKPKGNATETTDG